MRTNHEIKTRHDLLDEKGRLIEPGYTKGLMMDYDKTKHKGGKFRLKEWDYYLIACDDFAVCRCVCFNWGCAVASGAQRQTTGGSQSRGASDVCYARRHTAIGADSKS